MRLSSRPTEREFHFPVEPPRAWWTWVAGVVVHLPVVAAIWWSTAGWMTRNRMTSLFPPLAVEQGPAEVAMAFRRIAVPAGPSREPVAPAPVTRGARPSAAPDSGSTPLRPSVIQPSGGGATLPAPVAVTAPPAQAEEPARAQLTPAFGSGKLWVRPLPLSAREMAAAVTGKSKADIADSVVAVIVQRYLDELAAEQADPANRAPSWVANLGGQKIGVDPKWVYLGPIRLPTILLGLLPINAQGNPTQAEMNKRFAAMREDLFYAARRAATLEEFKRNVAILREQKQYEYDLRKAQRTHPDSVRRP
jgi:hypothetical protein